MVRQWGGDPIVKDIVKINSVFSWKSTIQVNLLSWGHLKALFFSDKKIIVNLFFISARPNISYNCILFRFSRPNPLQYFLVPDIEVENGDDDEDVEDEEEVGAFQFET